MTQFDVFLDLENVDFDVIAGADNEKSEIIDEGTLDVGGRRVLRRELRLAEDGISGPAGVLRAMVEELRIPEVE